MAVQLNARSTAPWFRLPTTFILPPRLTPVLREHQSSPTPERVREEKSLMTAGVRPVNHYCRHHHHCHHRHRHHQCRHHRHHQTIQWPLTRHHTNIFSPILSFNSLQQHYSHFTAEENEAQRDQVPCLRSPQRTSRGARTCTHSLASLQEASF